MLHGIVAYGFNECQRTTVTAIHRLMTLSSE